MKEVKIFNNTHDAIEEKKKRIGTWRSLHTDFTKSGKVKVTFVNGTHDPNNSKESKERQVQFLRQKELNKKLQNDTITFDELKELLRG